MPQILRLPAAAMIGRPADSCNLAGMEIRSAAVIGLGTMGAGILQPCPGDAAGRGDHAAGGTGAGVLRAAMSAGRPADTVGLHLGTGRLAELVTTPLSSPAAVASAAALARMHARYGDPAFAPVPLLAEHAEAGIPFCSQPGPA
jgi:hypothetical protein